jgi:hypothetical protein
LQSVSAKLEKAEDRVRSHKGSIQEKRGRYSEMLQERRKEVEEKELMQRVE